MEGEETLKIRQYAIESGFYSTMLERLHLITKDVKRVKVDQKEQKEEQIK